MADGIRDAGVGTHPGSERPPADPSSRVALAVATVFGVGYIAVAPGTFGSLVGLLLWAVIPASPFAQATAVIALLVVGCWSGGVAERHFGRTDPEHVVIDEVAGMMITLFLNPVSWVGAIGAFLLFRVADVIKPFPASRFENLHGGIGVMADDVMAAVYANLALRALLAFTDWVIG